MLAYNNTKVVGEALKRLDMLIVDDYFMTPTAALADYVLPAATWLERLDIAFPCMDHEASSFSGSAICQERFAGGWDCDFRDDYEFWWGLASRLGQTDNWWGPTAKDMLDFQVSGMGITYDIFYNDIKYYVEPSEHEKWKKPDFKFLTPTGKVELYSTIIEQMGPEYDPLPHYSPAAISPETRADLAEKYPLVMITGARFMPMYHSEHRQLGSYRDLHPDPTFDIHFDKAMELNIANGDWCWIETHLGRIKQRARTTTIVDPRVVNVQHDWWFPEKPEAEPSLLGVWESSANVITDDDPATLDPLIGSWQHTGLLCRVYKCEEGE